MNTANDASLKDLETVYCWVISYITLYARHLNSDAYAYQKRHFQKIPAGPFFSGSWPVVCLPLVPLRRPLDVHHRRALKFTAYISAAIPPPRLRVLSPASVSGIPCAVTDWYVMSFAPSAFTSFWVTVPRCLRTFCFRRFSVRFRYTYKESAREYSSLCTVSVGVLVQVPHGALFVGSAPTTWNTSCVTSRASNTPFDLNPHLLTASSRWSWPVYRGRGSTTTPGPQGSRVCAVSAFFLARAPIMLPVSVIRGILIPLVSNHAHACIT